MVGCDKIALVNPFPVVSYFLPECGTFLYTHTMLMPLSWRSMLFAAS